MCPPLIEGAHAGAPLQNGSFSYFYEGNLVLAVSSEPRIYEFRPFPLFAPFRPF